MAAITEERVREAREILRKYKDGKKVLETRIKEEEKWYRLRHWDVLRAAEDKSRPEPTSAWLFNTMMNKHADAMDNFPECNVLPREEGDREDAKTLSSIIPVILERCEFEGSYSKSWWEKLKHGTGIYGAFWNPRLENGLGDIDIKTVDILNIFWEPGIEDIQESRNVFVVNLRDNDLLEGEYPQLKGKLGGNGGLELAQYEHDDTIDLTGKSAVVDWYYKVTAEDGRTLLHYVKFVGDTVLFASEDEEQYAERGFYDHGKYPFVFDVLFPEKGTPCGFGYVALCKDPQMYIDKLSQLLLENAARAGRTRWLIGAQTGLNEEELKDPNREFIHVEGLSLDDAHCRQWEVKPLSGSFLSLLQWKTDEMKETSSNRDVSNGGTTSGATAAAAIAALQEAGNKTSRDMISASYRAYTKIDYMVIELIRQFYDLERSFRITGAGSQEYGFVRYSNEHIRTQQIGTDTQGNPLVRRAVFDIKIKAQKKNPFSRMSQNELAKELFGSGAFNPQMAQEAMCMLEMMEFEGKDRVLEQVMQGATLLNQVQQLSAQVAQLMEMLGMSRGIVDVPPNTGGGATPMVTPSTKGQTIDGAVETAMTPYMERIAKRSQVDMDAGALTPAVG